MSDEEDEDEMGNETKRGSGTSRGRSRGRSGCPPPSVPGEPPCLPRTLGGRDWEKEEMQRVQARERMGFTKADDRKVERKRSKSLGRAATHREMRESGGDSSKVVAEGGRGAAGVGLTLIGGALPGWAAV
jgi:hypothetical protein